MKVVVVGPADAAVVAASWATPLLPRLENLRPYAGRPTELLVHALLGAGLEVELVTLSPSVPGALTMSHGPLSVLIGHQRSHGRAKDLFRAERRTLMSLVGQTEGRVLHAQWTYEFAWSILADPRPKVVTVHDAPLTVLRRMPDPYRAMRTAMAYRVRAGSFRGIAVSPYAAGRWRREMFDPRPLQVIPNFVSGTSRRTPPTAAGPLLLSVGDGGALKNVRTLLRSLPVLRSRHPEVGLRLIGPGLGVADAMARWAAHNGLAAGVEWLGRRDHEFVLGEMAAADIVVHPSLEESFGMSVAEAMAMGLPVVGGQHSGAVPWLLADGAGLLVDVRSPQALADGVLRVMEQPGLADRLGAAAAARIDERFSRESVLRAHIDVYEKAVSKGMRSSVVTHRDGTSG
jgi:glycosyltransferase involved in cell wall biosynthesis